MTVLAVDLGGTKTLVALADGGHLRDTRAFSTSRAATPDQLLENIRDHVSDWDGLYNGVALAVTGRIADGFWSALNDKILNIEGKYPLSDRVAGMFGHVPVLANDAQAAAYGEFVFAADMGSDMVFLTISTGVGGGIVADGRLLTGANGLAGHFGQTRRITGERLEDRVSGKAMERQARALGHNLVVPEIFEQAETGVPWAEGIFDSSAQGVAALCADIKLTLDPAHIVIGGGIGLVPNYLNRVKSHLRRLRLDLQPELRPAALGANAGVLGIAALHNAKTT
ncbi:ROK family protein [uncultured Roseobacter sp.]|uniref:ROK family protein n=1 Tax=uncultured Roseobacter sp. TaxID=114847 RepID=UPI002609B2E0|nr:ROK family protein [uncultured Roseobacter sp.]